MEEECRLRHFSKYRLTNGGSYETTVDSEMATSKNMVWTTTN